MEEEFDEWDESEEPTFEENIEDDDFLWRDADFDEQETCQSVSQSQYESSEWTSEETMENEAEELHKRAEGIERPKSVSQIPFGHKWCPTRHGCQGATDCDYCMGCAK